MIALPEVFFFGASKGKIWLFPLPGTQERAENSSLLSSEHLNQTREDSNIPNS